MLKNIHVTIKGEDVCLTELFNMILDFILAVVKGEFPELDKVMNGDAE